MYNNNNNNNKNKNKLKTYTIVDFPEDNQTYGTFKENIPKKAANKALTSLLKFIDTDNINNKDSFLGKFVVFVIKDTETNKMYKYIGTRIKLENTIKDGNGEYKYKNVIGKYKKELDSI